MSSLKSPAERLTQISKTLKANISSTSNKDEPTLSQVVQPVQPEVLHRKQFTGRTFILNRPKALNSLNLSMIRNIAPQLQAWEQSDICKVIILKSNHPKAFCAGGDVKIVAEAGANKDPEAPTFFYEEYSLNYQIATLKTPLVALIDGITMGGGVGISVHAPFRVATEKTLFAMPETAIGLFPDVGGSFFLPRLDGELGTYLGLTGFRLKGQDVMRAGIATHYVPSERLSALEDRLSELDLLDHDVVNQALEEFSSEPNTEPFILDSFRNIIDRCFKHNSVKEIISALEKEETEKEWVESTIKLLRSASPTSLIITREQLRRGKSLSMAQCLNLEYHLAKQFLASHDFPEGVSAKLVRKETPHWSPATLEEINEKELILEYFDKIDMKALPLSTGSDFNQYPYSHYGLPSELEVKEYLTQASISLRPTVDDLANHFLITRDQKLGTKAKLLSIIQNCCEVDYDSNEIFWKKD